MTTAALYTLYGSLAVGAAGLYLILPSARRAGHPLRWAGAVLAAAGLAAAATYWTRWIGPAFEGRAFFVIFAAVAVVAAVRVITHPRPVYSAVYFVLVLLAVAGLCVLAAAEFLAAALVIVYGGAILATYVFVIMLAQPGRQTTYDRIAREPMAAVTLGFVMAAAATQAMVSTTDPIAAHVTEAAGRRVYPIPDQADRTTRTAAANEGDGGAMRAADIDPGAASGGKGNVRAMGETLMTTYIMAVEIAGVLLLVAMIGAVAIARKRIEPEALTPAERSAALRAEKQDPRRGGREAAPV